jgi:hypothetical protein
MRVIHSSIHLKAIVGTARTPLVRIRVIDSSIHLEPIVGMVHRPFIRMVQTPTIRLVYRQHSIQFGPSIVSMIKTPIIGIISRYSSIKLWSLLVRMGTIPFIGMARPPIIRVIVLKVFMLRWTILGKLAFVFKPVWRWSIDWHPAVIMERRSIICSPCMIMEWRAIALLLMENWWSATVFVSTTAIHIVANATATADWTIGRVPSLLV